MSFWSNRIVLFAFLSIALQACWGDCPQEETWCNEESIFKCTNGYYNEVRDCAMFEMVCVETQILSTDKLYTTCALSNEPCKDNQETICIDERLGTCGITEYPVCESPSNSGNIGLPGDCESCIN